MLSLAVRFPSQKVRSFMKVKSSNGKAVPQGTISINQNKACKHLLRKAYTDCESCKSKYTDKGTLNHTTKPEPITATPPYPALREPPECRKPNLNCKRPVKPQNTFFVGHSQEVRSKMYISEVHLESYLLDTQGLSSKNVVTIVRNIRSIQRVWGVLEPSNENALLLKAAMREKGRSPNAIRQYLWAMKYWAKSYGKDIDFKAVPLPKPEKTVPKILDFQVVRDIIQDESLSIRDRVIFMVFAFTACRVGELAPFLKLLQSTYINSSTINRLASIWTATA